MLTEKMVSPVISSLSYYKYMICNQPPVSMVAYFKDYFRYVKFQLDRPLQAKKVNELKPGLLEVIAGLERSEPDHSAILKTLMILNAVLEKFDVFLAELVKCDFDGWSPEIVDINRSAPGTQTTIPDEILAGSQSLRREGGRAY